MSGIERRTSCPSFYPADWNQSGVIKPSRKFHWHGVIAEDAFGTKSGIKDGPLVGMLRSGPNRFIILGDLYWTYLVPQITGGLSPPGRLSHDLLCRLLSGSPAAACRAAIPYIQHVDQYNTRVL